MSFSKYLESKKQDCLKLVLELSKYFKYVSILASDVKNKSIMANKSTSSISESMGNECGFVIKMTNGKGIYEYSLDTLDGNLENLAKEIYEELQINEELESKTLTLNIPSDEALIKDFERPSDFNEYSSKELLDYCIETKDKLLSMDNHIVNAISSLRLLSVSKMFITKNKQLTQYYTWVNNYSMIVYAKDGKMRFERTGANYNMIKPALDEMQDLLAPLVDKAAKLINAKPITPGVYDVITDPSITGLIAHEAFGHGVEMDQFVKDRALAKKYVGKYVASPICNMKDGAAKILSQASYFFDDDGILACDTQIIKDGILVNGLSDMTSALLLNTTPTGNGRRESYKKKAYARMTNTYFEKGNDKLEDMIKSIKHGYMVFETNNGMEDPKNWAIQCTANYGIEIVDGKLTDNYVSPVVMSGYVPDLLKSISMISDDFKIEGSGACGKGYKEWVLVSDGGPALKCKVKLS